MWTRPAGRAASSAPTPVHAAHATARPACRSSAPAQPGRCATTIARASCSSRQRCHCGKPRNASMPTMRHNAAPNSARKLASVSIGVGRPARDQLAIVGNEPALVANRGARPCSAATRRRSSARSGAADSRTARSARRRDRASLGARAPCAGGRSGSDRTYRRRCRSVACGQRALAPSGGRSSATKKSVSVVHGSAGNTPLNAASTRAASASSAFNRGALNFAERLFDERLAPPARRRCACSAPSRLSPWRTAYSSRGAC